MQVLAIIVIRYFELLGAQGFVSRLLTSIGQLETSLKVGLPLKFYRLNSTHPA